MHAYVMTAPGEGAVREVPEPVVGDYDAAVDLLWCGICSSTDRMLRQGTFRGGVRYPSILGHESVGRVTAVGERVRSLAVGDLVTRPAAYTAADAPLAMHWGGLAERGVVTDWSALRADRPAAGAPASVPWVRLPASTDPEAASLAISLSETYSVACREDLLGARVAVVGTGVAGLSLIRWTRLLGAASVAVVGRREERVQLGVAAGADVAVLADAADQRLARVDVVFDASGQAGMIDRELRWLRPGGSLIVYSAPEETASIDLMAAPRDARVSVAATDEQRVLLQVLGLIESGFVARDAFATHRFDLDSIADCFAEIDRGTVVKALVRLS